MLTFPFSGNISWYSNIFNILNFFLMTQSLFITRHGTPTAVLPAGIDLLTNAIAPITAFSPISILCLAVIEVRIPI